MQYIIDGKKFDTSKSKLIIKFKQRAKELTRSLFLQTESITQCAKHQCTEQKKELLLLSENAKIT